MKNLLYILIIIFFPLHGQNPNCQNPEFYLLGYGGTTYGQVILKFEMLSATGPVLYQGSTQNTEISNPYVGDLNSNGYMIWIGLAIADFGEGNLFYGENADFFSEIYEVLKNHENQWHTVLNNQICQQLGGKGAHLYLQSHYLEGYTEKDNIQYFDGTHLTTIWESQNDTDRLRGADITVDDDGNAYFLTGNQEGNATLLNIIQPNGDMMAQFPISLEFSASAGSFFMHNRLFLYSAIDHIITPVHITSTGAIVENQIILPKIQIGSTPNGLVYFAGADAAACHSFHLDLAISDFMAQKSVHIYPNPTKADLYYTSKETIDIIELFDITGKKLENFPAQLENGKLNLRHLPTAVYIV